MENSPPSIKSNVWASPFTIIQDTLEKRPWTFTDFFITKNGRQYLVQQNTIRRRLRTGDYAPDGFEDKVTIERKNPADCIASITQHRKRFERLLTRMSAYRWSAIVVESNWDDLLRLCAAETKVSPVSLDGSITAFIQRYPNVHWVFRPTRAIAMKTCWLALDRFWQDRSRYDV